MIMRETIITLLNQKKLALGTAVTLTVEFELISQRYTVTFTVTQGTSSVEGATANFDGINYTTNASVIVAVTNVEVGTYNYTVSMTGYTDATGTVTVTDADVNETVSLTRTGIGTNSMSSIMAYPNPFDNQIAISNAEKVKRVVITNIIGQQVITVNLNGKDWVATSNPPNGIYLITLEDHNGQRTVQKMIKR